MYVICIESSNSRGMGHLFRALLYIDYLNKNNKPYKLLINNDERSLRILQEHGIDYIIVDFDDLNSDWEKKIIVKYNVSVWINDKFITSIDMARHVTQTGAKLCLIDDVGEADKYADIHFAGMIYPTKQNIGGKRTYCGNEYIILNPEIERYRRKRKELKRIIVSMGGSDPHEVTIAVLEELKKYHYDVDIIIGPNFKRKKDLEKINCGSFHIYQNVPSLIKTFYEYDLAITGGGVTCCEANAAGLPCIIIANAPHEINTGKYVESMGGAVYAGSYDDWNRDILRDINKLDIEKMSICGMNKFRLDTVQRMMEIIDDRVEEAE